MRWLCVGLLAACGSDQPLADAPRGDVPQATPAIVITPATADFGTIPVDTSTAPTRFTVTNETANDTGNHLFFSLLGEYQVVTSTCAFAVPAHGTCEVDIAFAPATYGNGGGHLDAFLGSHLIIASTIFRGFATGLDLFSVAPNGHDFGGVPVGQTSAPQTFIVTNTGAVVTQAIVITPGGSDPLQFVFANDTCTGHDLAPSASCMFTVTFAPTIPASMTARLEIVSTKAELAVGVSGTGT